jgi:BMFP domain-containing protein YqiC
MPNVIDKLDNIKDDLKKTVVNEQPMLPSGEPVEDPALLEDYYKQLSDEGNEIEQIGRDVEQVAQQKNDLNKQEQILKEYAISNGYKVDCIFKDIASGMNESRKELNELIRLVIENKVNKIFISYKDS